MVDSTDPGFYGAAWRFIDFCQQLLAGSVYLQFVLKSCELPGSLQQEEVIRQAGTQELACTENSVSFCICCAVTRRIANDSLCVLRALCGEKLVHDGFL